MTPRLHLSALTFALLLVVQASGEISVHAQLVRVHSDISPGPHSRPRGRSRGERVNGLPHSEVLVIRRALLVTYEE
jgi:hypothetical protein